MKLRTLFALIGCNLIWSAHPAMGKILLQDVPPATGAWLRYAGALMAYLMGLAFLRLRPSQGFMKPNATVILLGFLTFCFSPVLQMTGLNQSKATDNSLIIAMEPMMTVFIAWLVVKERPTKLQFASLAVALAGFSMLSGLSPAKLTHGMDAHLVGNLIMLISLSGEASFSALGRKLLSRNSPLAVFGTALVAGVLTLSLASALLGQFPATEHFANLSWEGVLAVFWLGPLGTTATYLYWMFALTQAPIASIVLTIFIQPLFGTLWGHLFLSERLSTIQALGGVLILVAVFIESGRQMTRHDNEKISP